MKKRLLASVLALALLCTVLPLGALPALADEKDNEIDYGDLSGCNGNHSYTSEITTPATCGKDGVLTYTCSVCGSSKTESIPATGEHTYGDGVVTKEATCAEPGEKTFTCSVCGGTSTETIPATGNHTYDEGVVTKEATCAEAGEKTFTCDLCGDTYTEPIPATGEHTYDEGVVTKEATCTEPGEKTFTCTVCGDAYTEPIPATGEHTYDEGVVTKEATCTEPGEKTFTCTVCGDTTTEAIKALGHNWSTEWTVDVEPTTTTEGSKSHHCTRCDAKTDVTVIPKLITGWYTNEETGLVYYYYADGKMNTETRIQLDGIWYNFYPANSIVDGVDVSYSYLVGWKKMPSKITRYYPEGAYWFYTGFQEVDGNKYFFNKTSGALYIPPANEVLYGVGWYIESGAYYALDPATGAWIRGLYTDKNGDTYYFTKYDTNACYTTGLVKDNGNTYYFDPATGKRVENKTCVVGAATLTFDENGVLVKKVGLYEGYLYGEDGEPAAGQMMLCPDGMLYRSSTGGKLDLYYVRKDPRDSSKNIYILNGKVLEGLVTITEADLKSTYAKTEFPEITVAGVYLFEGNTKTYVKGFGKAPNGLEYFFRPGNGTRYEPSATYAQLTMADGSKQIVNFYKKGTVVDGVDYSYVHKVGLVTENGNLYYYEDGTVGCVKGKTVTVDGVQYALDADTGIATIVE